MLRAQHHEDVLRPVVGRVAVEMMDHLLLGKVASQHFLGHQYVLEDPASVGLAFERSWMLRPIN